MWRIFKATPLSAASLPSSCRITRRLSSRRARASSSSGRTPDRTKPPSRASAGRSSPRPSVNRARNWARSGRRSGVSARRASAISEGSSMSGSRASVKRPATVAPIARPSRRRPRSRGPPRPSANRPSARAMSPRPRSASRNCWRCGLRSQNQPTASRRASMATGSSNGRASLAASSRAPGEVTVRSMAARSEPSRPPEVAFSISRLVRVAGSMAMTSASPARRGADSAGARPAWVVSRWAAIRPRAEISAGASAPNPSRVSTP